MACNYLYPGSSDPAGFGTAGTPQPAWDELTAGNVPGDRLALGSYGPFTFQPGAVQELDFAYIFGRAVSGGNLASVNLVKERIDSVRQKFSNGITGCGCATTTGIAALSNNEQLSVFPNPAGDQVTVYYTGEASDLVIYDVAGREVKHTKTAAKMEKHIDISGLSKGLYIIEVRSDQKATFSRFIKQ
jgi:hypothetical protein